MVGKRDNGKRRIKMYFKIMDEETINMFLDNSTCFKDTISCGSLFLRRGWEFPRSSGNRCSAASPRAQWETTDLPWISYSRKNTARGCPSASLSVGNKHALSGSGTDPKELGFWQRTLSGRTGQPPAPLGWRVGCAHAWNKINPRLKSRIFMGRNGKLLSLNLA